MTDEDDDEVTQLHQSSHTSNSSSSDKSSTTKTHLTSKKSFKHDRSIAKQQQRKSSASSVSSHSSANSSSKHTSSSASSSLSSTSTNKATTRIVSSNRRKSDESAECTSHSAIDNISKQPKARQSSLNESHSTTSDKGEQLKDSERRKSSSASQKSSRQDDDQCRRLTRQNETTPSVDSLSPSSESLSATSTAKATSLSQEASKKSSSSTSSNKSSLATNNNLNRDETYYDNNTTIDPTINLQRDQCQLELQAEYINQLSEFQDQQQTQIENSNRNHCESLEQPSSQRISVNLTNHLQDSEQQYLNQANIISTNKVDDSKYEKNEHCPIVKRQLPAFLNPAIVTPFHQDEANNAFLLAQNSCSEFTSTIKKGVLWQQRNYEEFHKRLFSRWKKRFFVLTTSYLVCFKHSTPKVGRSEMGQFLYKRSLNEFVKVNWARQRRNDRGIISLRMDGQFNLYLWCKSGLDEWMQLIKEALDRCKYNKELLEANKAQVVQVHSSQSAMLNACVDRQLYSESAYFNQQSQQTTICTTVSELYENACLPPNINKQKEGEGENSLDLNLNLNQQQKDVSMLPALNINDQKSILATEENFHLVKQQQQELNANNCQQNNQSNQRSQQIETNSSIHLNNKAEDIVNRSNVDEHDSDENKKLKKRIQSTRNFPQNNHLNLNGFSSPQIVRSNNILRSAASNNNQAQFNHSPITRSKHQQILATPLRDNTKHHQQQHINDAMKNSQAADHRQKLFQLQMLHNNDNYSLYGGAGDFQVYSTNNEDLINNKIGNNFNYSNASNRFIANGGTYGYSSMRSNMKSAASEFAFIRPTGSNTNDLNEQPFINNQGQLNNHHLHNQHHHHQSTLPRKPLMPLRQQSVEANNLRNNLHNNLASNNVDNNDVIIASNKQNFVLPNNNQPLIKNKKRANNMQQNQFLHTSAATPSSSSSKAQQQKALTSSSDVKSSIAQFLRRAFWPSIRKGSSSKRDSKLGKHLSRNAGSCNSSLAGAYDDAVNFVPVVPSAFSTGSKSFAANAMRDTNFSQCNNNSSSSQELSDNKSSCNNAKQPRVADMIEAFVANVDACNVADKQHEQNITRINNKPQSIHLTKFNAFNSPLHKSNSMNNAIQAEPLQQQLQQQQLATPNKLYSRQQLASNRMFGQQNEHLNQNNLLRHSAQIAKNSPQRQTSLFENISSEASRKIQHRPLPRPSSIYGQPSMIMSPISHQRSTSNNSNNINLNHRANRQSQFEFRNNYINSHANRNSMHESMLSSTSTTTANATAVSASEPNPSSPFINQQINKHHQQKDIVHNVNRQQFDASLIYDNQLPQSMQLINQNDQSNFYDNFRPDCQASMITNYQQSPIARPTSRVFNTKTNGLQTTVIGEEPTINLRSSQQYEDKNYDSSIDDSIEEKVVRKQVVNIAGAPGVNLDPSLAASLLKGTNIDAFETSTLCRLTKNDEGKQSGKQKKNDKAFLISTRLSQIEANN